MEDTQDYPPELIVSHPLQDLSAKAYSFLSWKNSIKKQL